MCLSKLKTEWSYVDYTWVLDQGAENDQSHTVVFRVYTNDEVLNAGTGELIAHPYFVTCLDIVQLASHGLGLFLEQLNHVSHLTLKALAETFKDHLSSQFIYPRIRDKASEAWKLELIFRELLLGLNK